MAITDQLDRHRRAALQEMLGEEYKRFEEIPDTLFMSDESLELYHFVDSLLAIDSAFFKSQIKPSLHTRQGMMSSGSEALGFSDKRGLRVWIRTFVFLSSSARKMAKPEGGVLIPSDLSFRKDIDGWLKAGKEDLVRQACIAEANAIKASWNSFEQRLSDIAVNIPEDPARIAAAGKIQKFVRNTKGRRKLQRWTTAMSKVSRFEADYKRVGTDVMAVKRQGALNTLETDLAAMKNTKFRAFQTSWNQQAAVMRELGALIDEVNTKFEEAVKADDKTFEKARDFKLHCVQNLFSAVSSYAPPPFNLVGTVGTTFCQVAGKTFEAAVYGIEMAKTYSTSDQDLHKAAVRAEKKIEEWKKLALMDHGIKTELQAANVSSIDIIRKSQENCAKNFYAALDEITFDEFEFNPDLSDFQRKVHREIRDNNFANIANSGRVVGDLEIKIQRNYGSAFDNERNKRFKEFKNKVNKIKLPPFAINQLGNPDLIKRYLYLFLTGLYIKEKVQNNKNRFFTLGKEMVKLLSDPKNKVNFLHSYSKSAARMDSNLGMSLPYVLQWSIKTHNAYTVRVNSLLIQYASVGLYDPFQIMLDRTITAAKANEYLDMLERDVSRQIDQAKAASGKKAAYHALEADQGARYKAAVKMQARRRGNLVRRGAGGP